MPFFVRLHSTFQDAERLYFVMTYARNGDLLGFIDKLAESVRLFYIASNFTGTFGAHLNGLNFRGLRESVSTRLLKQFITTGH